jgi:tripartite-type tricarboxylate transporter receptor subunit TctC
LTPLAHNPEWEDHMVGVHVRAALVAAVVAAMPLAAEAQDYPSRPVEISVGQPAGGIIDVVTRIVADDLQTRLGQPFLVVNRTGGGGTIAAQYVVQAAPDGYNLLALGSSMSFNAALGGQSYAYPEDFTTIAQFGIMPSVVAVPASVPATTVAEFVEWTKANPGTVNYGSAGVGSGAHIFTASFKDLTGADIAHVPYTGAPAVANAMLAGEVSLFIGPVPVLAPFIERGELKALAVTTRERIAKLPDVPTMIEAGFPDYVGEQYIGLFGPKDMPDAIVQELNGAINAHLADPAIVARLDGLSVIAEPMAADAYHQAMVEDVRYWTEVVDRTGARNE